MARRIETLDALAVGMKVGTNGRVGFRVVGQ
jgi:hypothetical protein